MLCSVIEQCPFIGKEHLAISLIKQHFTTSYISSTYFVFQVALRRQQAVEQKTVTNLMTSSQEIDQSQERLNANKAASESLKLRTRALKTARMTSRNLMQGELREINSKTSLCF